MSARYSKKKLVVCQSEKCYFYKNEIYFLKNIILAKSIQIKNKKIEMVKN